MTCGERVGIASATKIIGIGMNNYRSAVEIGDGNTIQIETVGACRNIAQIASMTFT